MLINRKLRWKKKTRFHLKIFLYLLIFCVCVRFVHGWGHAERICSVELELQEVVSFQCGCSELSLDPFNHFQPEGRLSFLFLSCEWLTRSVLQCLNYFIECRISCSVLLWRTRWQINFFILIYLLFIYFGCVWEPQQMVGSQRTTSWSQFFPLTWVPGTELKSLVVSIFTAEPSCPLSMYLF